MRCPSLNVDLDAAGFVTTGAGVGVATTVAVVPVLTAGIVDVLPMAAGVVLSATAVATVTAEMALATPLGAEFGLGFLPAPGADTAPSLLVVLAMTGEADRCMPVPGAFITLGNSVTAMSVAASERVNSGTGWKDCWVWSANEDVCDNV